MVGGSSLAPASRWLFKGITRQAQPPFHESGGRGTSLPTAASRRLVRGGLTHRNNRTRGLPTAVGTNAKWPPTCVWRIYDRRGCPDAGNGKKNEPGRRVWSPARQSLNLAKH